MKKSAKTRQSSIKKMIKSDEEVQIAVLAEKFGVSEMTIRRDLDHLAAQGQVERIHGGAAITEKMEFEFNFANRRSSNQRAKKAIACRVLKFIKPGHKVILDTGTTTLELAYLLKDFKNLTVITPSLAVASVLQFSSGVQVVLLGGIIRKGSPDLTGVVTEKVLDMFMVDIAFQGADSIGLNGELFNSDMRIAKVDHKMRRRAQQTYILCDSSKIGKTDFASNGSLTEVDALITDNRISPEHLGALAKLKTQIIVSKI